MRSAIGAKSGLIWVWKWGGFRLLVAATMLATTGRKKKGSTDRRGRERGRGEIGKGMRT